uniref:H(+)-transporting two-sector ATPase n=1 Tax=Psilotum nudum TaxID=3240 RepID=A0A1B3TRM0_PSINU|nr:ATPase subunit 8 [Psilotum nudum]AOH05939.1 ATPase subunit 8 [Psilotum nudum]
MPQPDQFTYLTQFIRLCVLYSTLYVFLYHNGLPKISRILKLRVMISVGGGQSPSNAELLPEVVFEEGFNTSVYYPDSSVSRALQWLHQMVESLKIDQSLRINNSYVCSLGEISSSQVPEEQALNPSYYQNRLFPAWHTYIAAVPNGVYILRGQSSTLCEYKENGGR